MADKPVDLTNLRDLIDGDAEMEQMLLEEFLSSSKESMDELAANQHDGEHETWRKAAHALKGLAYNLGAEPLGVLSSKAQNEYAATESVKHTLYEELGRVSEGGALHTHRA